MDRIWAGWRSAYLSGELNLQDKPLGCVLCTIAGATSETADQDSLAASELLIVHRGASSTVALNLYPYTSGHLLVIPHRHVSELDALVESERSEMFELANAATIALSKSHGAQGFNIGMNLGGAAGAAIKDHIHMHVVPRFVGDANFMTTTADARVLPEALTETLEKVRGAWKVAGCS